VLHIPQACSPAALLLYHARCMSRNIWHSVARRRLVQQGLLLLISVQKHVCATTALEIRSLSLVPRLAQFSGEEYLAARADPVAAFAAPIAGHMNADHAEVWPFCRQRLWYQTCCPGQSPPCFKRRRTRQVCLRDLQLQSLVLCLAWFRRVRRLCFARAAAPRCCAPSPSHHTGLLLVTAARRAAQSTAAMLRHYAGLTVDEARITGVDRLGLDLACRRGGDSLRARLPFVRPAEGRKDVKDVIVEMTRAAAAR